MAAPNVLAVKHSDPLLGTRLLDLLARLIEILFILLVFLAELVKLEDSVEGAWLLLFLAATIGTMYLSLTSNHCLFELILPLCLPDFVLDFCQGMPSLQLSNQGFRALFSGIHEATAFLSYICCRHTLVDQFELKRSDILLDLLHLPRHLWRGCHHFLRNDLRLRLDGYHGLWVLRHLRVYVEESVVTSKERILLPRLLL